MTGTKTQCCASNRCHLNFLLICDNFLDNFVMASFANGQLKGGLHDSVHVHESKYCF